jgi:hypothetical protein
LRQIALPIQKLGRRVAANSDADERPANIRDSGPELVQFKGQGAAEGHRAGELQCAEDVRGGGQDHLPVGDRGVSGRPQPHRTHRQGCAAHHSALQPKEPVHLARSILPLQVPLGPQNGNSGVPAAGDGPRPQAAGLGTQANREGPG